MDLSDKILLTDNNYLVQKFQQKGGWHYVLLHDIDAKPTSKRGMLPVIAIIDNNNGIEQNLMPFGNGKFFLTLNANIRKQINKNEGDTIHLKLYGQNETAIGIDDFYACLNDDKVAYENFQNLAANKQKEIIDNINAAKTNDTKINRIAQELNRLIGI